MTIPSRPAPAPPGSRGQDAANASLEQLRLQLQQQQQQQKLMIKLPPPPKRPGQSQPQQQQHQHNISNNNNTSSTSSITRKFPPARYTPTTSWDDSPFSSETGNNNNHFKKVPPPRPPPPKVQSHTKKSAAPAPPAIGVLSNIFHRNKKNTSNSNSKASASQANATRIYNISSGNYGSTASSNNGMQQSNGISNGSYNTHTNTASWSTSWNSSSTNYSSNSYSTHTTTTTSATQEAQLISFDSPPSSPTFTQKSNSDCVSVDSFSSDSNFSSPQNGSVSQPESGFEDDFSGTRSRPATTSPLDPWETVDMFGGDTSAYISTANIGTAPVRNLNTVTARIQSSNDNPLCNGKSLLPPPQALGMPTIIKPKIAQKPKAPQPPVFLKQFPTATPSFANTDEPTTPPSPPMPKCAPPPPPAGVSLLDVISGKVDAIHLSSNETYSEEDASPPYGIALYNFDGVEEGDLAFRENEKIYLIEQVSEEWYRGRTRAGCEGIFPVNYIEIKVPLKPAGAGATPDPPTNQSSLQLQSGFGRSAPQQCGSNKLKVRCLYNFPAEVEGDLGLNENDLVTILYRINEDWLFGEINGRQGQFPANFLEYVPDNIPMP